MDITGCIGIIRTMTGYKPASLGESICKGPGTVAWDRAPVAQNGISVLARRQSDKEAEAESYVC